MSNEKNTTYNTGECRWTYGSELPGDWHRRKGPCPLCGTPTFNYGGGWRCMALYCNNNENNPAPSVGAEPTWWNTGIQVKKDGNAWFAHNADFINLQVSVSGWGKTPGEAVDNLKKYITE